MELLGQRGGDFMDMSPDGNGRVRFDYSIPARGIIGIHSRRNDLVVNPLKAKQLTNIRAAGKDDNILLTPPLTLTLEQALGFINDDELVEVTPDNIRIRKKLLKEYERKRAARTSEELAC